MQFIINVQQIQQIAPTKEIIGRLKPIKTQLRELIKTT